MDGYEEDEYNGIVYVQLLICLIVRYFIGKTLRLKETSH